MIYIWHIWSQMAEQQAQKHSFSHLVSYDVTIPEFLKRLQCSDVSLGENAHLTCQVIGDPGQFQDIFSYHITVYLYIMNMLKKNSNLFQIKYWFAFFFSAKFSSTYYMILFSLFFLINCHNIPSYRWIEKIHRKPLIVLTVISCYQSWEKTVNEKIKSFQCNIIFV